MISRTCASSCSFASRILEEMSIAPVALILMVIRSAEPGIAEPVPAYNLSAFGNSASKIVAGTETGLKCECVHRRSGHEDQNSSAVFRLCDFHWRGDDAKVSFLVNECRGARSDYCLW